jgi:tRNA-splicing endonuclease subunit Sen34
MRQEEEKKVAALRAQFGDAGDAARAKREARARKRAGAQKAAALAAGEEESAVNAAYEVAIAAIGAETEGKGKEKEKANANAKDKAKDEPMASADNTSVFTIVPALPIVPDLLPNTSTTLSSTAFPFPRTVRDSALADSFDALHARGLRMGLGPRFGGEYLIYPGDYLRYHAHFTSQIIVRDEPIRPAELVAWGRLGTGTKKAGLLCCWDDGGRGDEPVKGTGEVEFFSLEWANFG